MPPGQRLVTPGRLLLAVFGCPGRFGRLGRLGRRVRVEAVSGRGFAGRGGVSVVGHFVEEDVVLQRRVGVGVALGLFREEHLQADSDAVLMREDGEQGGRRATVSGQAKKIITMKYRHGGES